jgi:parvulin-like peptidyl-prolyl isomerase
VVRIGKDSIITLKAFKEDFQKNNPKASDQKAIFKDYKKQLDRLIDHEIKVISAYQLGLDKDSSVTDVIEHNKQKLLLSKLYEKEIVDPLIKESEIRDYYARTGSEVLVRTILFKIPPQANPSTQDSIKAKAMDVFNRIKKGELFSDMARKYSEDEATAINGGIVGLLTYTRSNDPIRNASFSMKAGEISEPIKNTIGYNIIKVEEIRQKERLPFDKVRDEIRNQLKQERKEQLSKSARKYWDKVKENSRLVWNEKALDTLLTYFSHSKRYNKPELVNTIKSLPEDVQKLVLLKSKKTEINVKDMQKRIEETVSPFFGIPFGNKETIKQYLEGWVLTEHLLALAAKKGFAHDNGIQTALKNTMEKEMVNLLNNKYIYSDVNPTQEEIRDFYEKEKLNNYTSAEMVRIQEVQVKDRKLAEKIKKLTKNKWDLRKYPAQYTVRPGMKENNGIFPLFKRGERGKIGEVAFSLKVGETGGPIALEDGTYSLFKVLAKIPAKTRPFESSQRTVNRDLKKFLQKEKEQAWLEAKRKEFSIKIDRRVLQGIINEK